jgi:hypothetical protein
MKILSEKTNETYKTVAECVAAEKAYDEKVAKEKAERAAAEKNRQKRKNEVEQARKDAEKAISKYINLNAKYNKDYEHENFSSFVLSDAFPSSLIKMLF